MLRLVRGISAAFIPLALLAGALALAAEPLFVAEAVVDEPRMLDDDVVATGPERVAPEPALLAAAAARTGTSPERVARCLRLTRYAGKMRIACRDNDASLTAPAANAAAEAYVEAARLAREAVRVRGEAWLQQRMNELMASARDAQARAARHQSAIGGAPGEAARVRQRELERDAMRAREMLDAFVERAGHAVFEPSRVRIAEAAEPPRGVNNARFCVVAAQLMAGALALSAAGVLLTRRPRASGSAP